MPSVSNFMKCEALNKRLNIAQRIILRLSECRSKACFDFAEREQNHEGVARVIVVQAECSRDARLVRPWLFE